jgi:hypothetical protein
MEGYVESAKKGKLDLSVLNQKPNKEYEEIWEAANNKLKVENKKDTRCRTIWPKIQNIGVWDLATI